MLVMDPIGLAASILTFVDFSSKVVARLHEFNSRTTDVPETFRTLVIQLPLLTVILQRLRHQAVIGHVDTTIAKALQPVINDTTEQTKYLGERLEKIIPPQSASKLDIGLKALKSIVSEHSVERALNKIHECVNLLVLHQTTSSTDLSASILTELQRLGDSPNPATSDEDTTALLHEAARQGQISSIRSILRLPTDVNAPDECGRTALHTAAASGQKEVARRLCFWKANVLVEDDFGQTPLHVAIAAGEIGVAKILLDKGASLDVEDDSGKKPLDYAEGCFLTRWRIRNGIALEAKDPKTGNTALIQAAQQGDADSLTKLILEGAKVEAKNIFARTALSEACIRGHAETVSILLDHGADSNSIDKTNASPVFYCVQFDHIEILQLLLDTGRANLEATSSPERRTPLLSAVYDHKWGLVDLLLRHGSNPHAKCPRAYSPLRSTVLWCQDASVLNALIKLFIECKVDLNVADGDGWTATAEAVNTQKFSTMELLLSNGASPHGRVEQYPYICKLALQAAPTGWLRVLVQKFGVDINATNDNGWTALREAISWGHVDSGVALLDLGADANNSVRNDDDNSSFPGHEHITMLMQAVWSARMCERTRYKRLIDGLVAHGARLEDEDSHAWTALRLAVEKDFEEVACHLLLKGANAYSVGRDGKSVLQEARERKMNEFCVMVDMNEAAL